MRIYRWRWSLAMVGIFLGLMLGLPPQQARSRSPNSEAQETLPGYWVMAAPLPNPTMDNAVMAYGDYLYSLDGYGGSYRYDPATDTWTKLPDMSPSIGDPADGCLGYNNRGEPLILLFSDTFIQNVIMAFNISRNRWEQRSIPSPLPASGLYQPDIASDPEHNVCYITGGETTSVQSTLYAYYPATNTAQQLPSFTTPTRNHASWFVPQWGEAGYVCIAGGYGVGGIHVMSTQCFDTALNAWHAENADLGALPHDWWGAADALKMVDGAPQLWLLGGAGSYDKMNETAYYDIGQGIWVEGPHLPYAVYRMEGDVVLDEIYVVAGDGGSINPTTYNQHHIQQPLPTCTGLPVFFDDFEGEPHWTSSGNYSLWHTEHQSNVCGSLISPFPSADTAWYYGDEEYECTYDAGYTSGYLIMNDTLPIIGSRYATIRFWSYEQTECNDSDLTCASAVRFLDISYDGGTTWTEFWQGFTEDRWYPVTVTTHVDPGDSLRLRFYFNNYNSLDSEYLGWFIDNVEVTACMEGIEPQLPQANFTPGPSACPGQSVTFTNTSSGTPPLSYAWDFGDGTTTNLPSPSHIYAQPGDYTVTLTATNSYGSDTMSQPYSVLPWPTAAFTYTPAYPLPGQLVQFSDLSLGDPFAWDWNFGDGYQSTLQNPWHTYYETGAYTVTLTAANACGWGEMAQQRLTVGPQTWFEEDDPAIAYSGPWAQLPCSQCSAGGQKAAARWGAAAEFTFTGTGVRWYMTKANMLGVARVYLDGAELGWVDLYSPTPQYQQVWEQSGLAPGAHTLRIEVSGKRNPRSSGRAITLDALEVIP